jgi:hypothetical protein
MGKVLTIDPGLRHCGVAIGEGDRLIACALIQNPETKRRDGAAWGAMARAVHKWAEDQGPFSFVRCETPMQYKPGHHGGKNVDPDDILQLQGVVGALSALYQIDTIYPYQWKGQLPKDVGYYRVKSKLDQQELELLQSAKCAESKRHNIGDAVGIFLNYVQRFK